MYAHRDGFAPVLCHGQNFTASLWVSVLDIKYRSTERPTDRRMRKYICRYYRPSYRCACIIAARLLG